MKSVYSLLAGACIAALPPFVHAELGPIVITPSRTEQPQNNSSATVYVMDAEEIEANGAITTSELLRGIPGVQIVDLYGNGLESNVSVRGFSSTANANTLVLVNGRRLNNSDISSPDLHHIFPQDIERIEVLVGSAGVLYGDQAVGGVVNIITKRPAESSHRVSFSAGSYDYRGIQFNSTARLTDSLGYRLSAETFETDHYRDNNSEKNANFSGMLDYQSDADRLFLEVQRINDDFETPGALLEDEFDDDPTQSDPSFDEDFRDETVEVYRAGYERNLGMHNFSIDATHRETEADVRQSRRGAPAPADGFNNRSNKSVNPKIFGDFDMGYGMSYVAGIDVEENEFDLDIPFPASAFGPAGSVTKSNMQDVESLYIQFNPMLTQRLQLTLGARHSEVENDITDGFSFPDGIQVDDDITVGELGLAYFVDDRTRLSIRIDENFRFAKVDELTGAGPGIILDTQTGESIEIGIDLTRGNHRLIASIYRLDLKNEIEFDPNAGMFGENVNLDKTRRDGLTLALTSQLSTNFRLKTEIGLVDARFESGSFDGNRISGVSDEIASLRGDYRISGQATAYLEYNYSSPRYPQGDNANELGEVGSITVYNAGLGYFYREWEIDFRVNNLADESYAEFVNSLGGFQPNPGRNYALTVGYRFE